MEVNSSSAPSVNLQSVDAMFATIISESRMTRDHLLQRMSAQDLELQEIKRQTTLTNGKVVGLLERERDRAVRISAVIACATACGGTLAFLAKKAFPGLF